MATKSQKSYLRPEHEIRAVDATSGRTKVRTNSRRLKDKDEREKQRLKRNEAPRPTKKDATHRRKHSHALTSTSVKEQPYFKLDMIGQPAKRIELGTAVDASVMISLARSSLDPSTFAERIDMSNVFAIASLVADNRHGETLPLEAGFLTGQKIFDSVHPIHADFPQRRSKDQLCRLVLGYFSFTGLLIRQAGTYRLRITLLRMSDTPGVGATSLLCIDSEPIKVERRGAGSQHCN